MKRIYSFLVALMACTSMQAQYVVSDKYDLWFEDTGHEVTTRKSVRCTDNYQDLWNGCFLIKQGTYWYAVDRDGDKLDGVYGDQVILLNNGRWKCIRGSYVTYID